MISPEEEIMDIKDIKDRYINWKQEFLKKCYIGRRLKIKWIKNPAPTSTKSSDIIGKSVNYVIIQITDKLLTLYSEQGYYNISISFTDIYSHDSIKRIEFL